MLMSCCSIAKLFFFRGHQDAVISQKSVIQLACAVLETLESPSNKHWEQMASIEKVWVYMCKDIIPVLDKICFGTDPSIENSVISSK